MNAKDAHTISMDNIEENPTIKLIREAARKGRFSLYVSHNEVYDAPKLKKLGYKLCWNTTDFRCSITWNHFK